MAYCKLTLMLLFVELGSVFDYIVCFGGIVDVCVDDTKYTGIHISLNGQWEGLNGYSHGGCCGLS